MKRHKKKGKNFKVCDVIQFAKIKRFKIGSEWQKVVENVMTFTIHFCKPVPY